MLLLVAVVVQLALQAVDCYRKAMQADNNNSEYAARAKALSKALGKKVQIEKAQVGNKASAQPLMQHWCEQLSSSKQRRRFNVFPQHATASCQQRG